MTSIGSVFRSWLHCRFAMQSRGEDILILENMIPGPWFRLQSQCEELLGRPHLSLQAQELLGGWPGHSAGTLPRKWSKVSRTPPHWLA